MRGFLQARILIKSMDTTQAQSARPALSSSLRILNRRNVSAAYGSPNSRALPKRQPSLTSKENSSRYERPLFSPANNNNSFRSPASNVQFPGHQKDLEALNSRFVATCGTSQDWRHGRSYRDTASEIISLYTHQSPHLSATPSLYGGSSRSKSFSTSSSRHTSSHKSFRAPRGHSDGGIRSRSPAPYSTRWNQPGIRPRSPIVKYGEDADYSGTWSMQNSTQQVRYSC